MYPSSKYTNGTTSQSIRTGTGLVYGIIVNSHTSGTMKLWDALTATGSVIINTFTFPTGSGIYMFTTPIEFYTGLFATVGGTIDYTLLTSTN